MKFIDTATIHINAGNGGKGHISFRHEKFVPKGGPDGGNGGKGGDVILKVDRHLLTLLDFKYKMHYSAENGVEGGKSRKTGKSGKDLVIRVPLGTVIKDVETEEVIADLAIDGMEYVIAKGGIGGRGNSEFATSTNQTPRYADPGRPGEETDILLELKLLADVGIVGFPNVGKSTLISVISDAKPKIADYPFTTLVPNLGMVRAGESKSYTVADIPGLLEGAHEGKGLGLQFLRHVERTRTLLFMIDSLSENPVQDYKILRSELRKYNKEMDQKNRIICLSRVDALDPETKAKLAKLSFREKGTPVLLISSVSGESIEELKRMMWKLVNEDHHESGD